MAARHPRGFRTIVVQGHRLRWCFRPSAPDSELVVVGPNRSGCRLVVVLRGWQDPWLEIAGAATTGSASPPEPPAENDPALVGPAFVRTAIERAMAAGWDWGARAALLRLEYRDGRFTGTA